MNNSWLQNKWRPISAMVYLAICVFDFVIFPMLWALFLVLTDSAEKSMMWDPLTLKGSGLFHISFGAILGVSAFTRGQEKVAKVNSSRYNDEETKSE